MRRWRAQFKLFSLVVAVAIVAGSVLAGSVLLVRSAEEAGVRDSLASMTGEQVDVTIRVLNPGRPVTETRQKLDAATARAYGPGVSWASSGWMSTDWLSTPSGVYSYLLELDDPSASAELVEGEWPTAGAGIAIPEAAARSLGVSVGDTFTLDDGAPLELTVEGIYVATPDTGVYWLNDPMDAAGNATNFPQPGKSFFFPVHAVGPLITAPHGVDASGVSPAQLSLVEHPTFAPAGAAGLAELRTRVADAEIEISRAAPTRGSTVIVDTQIAAAFDAVTGGLAATRSAALIVILLVLLVVGVAVASVTRLLADARSAEFELLRSRGASWPQTSLAVVIDAAAIALMVALASPWGGVLLHALVVGSPPLNRARIEPWVLPDSEVLWGAGVFAALIAALIIVPAVAPRRVIASSWAPAAAIAAESSVVVAAGLLIWRATTLDLAEGDLLLTATPAILLIAAVVIANRALVIATRGIAVLTAQSRGAIIPLGGWFAARGPGRSAGAVLIALTVGASVVILGVNATWQRSVHDEAAVVLGAPARVTAGEIAFDADARPDAAPVLRRTTLTSKIIAAGVGGSVPTAPMQLLGLSAAASAALAEGAPASAGGAAIAGTLDDEAAADTGPVIPRDATQLQATVSLTGPERVTAEIYLALEDEAGAIRVIPFEAVTTGATATLQAPIVTDGLQGELRLVAATMRLDPGVTPDDAPPLELRIASLATLTASGARTPLDLGAASSWQGVNSHDDKRPPAIAVTDTDLRITTTAGLGQTAVNYGAVGWRPLAEIAAIVPETLKGHLDVETGTQLKGFVAGTPIVLRVAGSTSGVPGSANNGDLAALQAGLPTQSRATTTLVVNATALAHTLVQASTPGLLVDEFWLPTRDTYSGDDPDVLIDTETLAQKMMEAPLRAEIPATSSIAIWASIMLALAGFGARTAAISRRRRLESAQLRALGLSRRGMLGVASADAGAVAAGGVVIGLGAGLVTLLLVGTRVVAAGGGASAGLVIPWQAVTLLPLVLLGALAAISLAIAHGQRRLPLAELLRVGADG